MRIATHRSTSPKRRIAQLGVLLSATCIVVASTLWPLTASAAPSENMTIWRAQIRLVTGNGNLHADTDDDIQVSLNDNNRTWLDYGRNDFEVVDDFTYDLTLTNLRTVSDIQYLAIQKTGTDGWCVDHVTLLINNQPIYYRSFRTDTALCRWVDADDGHSPSLTFSGTTLRSHALWRDYAAPARPERLTRAELQSRVEASVGNWIERHDSDYKWGNLYGSRYVESMVVDTRTLRFDLDMTAILNNRPDGEFDVDFDARFSCADGRLSVALLNVHLIERVPGLDAPGDPSIVDALQAALSAPLAALNSMLPFNMLLPCPSPLVDASGNLVIRDSSTGIDFPPIKG
jgi:hypothetical protein